MLTATAHRDPTVLTEPIFSQTPSCLVPQFALRHSELISLQKPPGIELLRVPRVQCPFCPVPPPRVPLTLLTSSNFLALYWSAPLRKLSRMMSHRTVP